MLEAGSAGRSMSTSKTKSTVAREELISRGLGWLLESTFFGHLNVAEQELALGKMRWFEYQRGEKMTHIGKISEGVDLLVYGQAVVMTHTTEGRERPVANVGPGHLIGERSILEGIPALAEVRASSRVRTLRLPRERFQELLDECPGFRKYVRGLVSLRTRWQSLIKMFSQNAFLRALGRDDVERVLKSGELLFMKRGETLVCAGERSDEVFVVVSGRVAVHAPAADGSHGERLAVAEPGELIGHAAILLELPRTADLVILDDAEVLRVEGAAFMEIVNRNPLVQRHLMQYLATLDMPSVRPDSRRLDRMVTFVCGTERGLGSTTVAYGIAASLRGEVDLVLVDLDGPETARKLGFRVEARKFEGVVVEEMAVPEAWDLRVVWPAKEKDLARLLSRLRAREPTAAADAPVFVTGRPAGELAKVALEAAEAVVFVRRPGDSLCDLHLRRGQLLFQAIRLEKGATLPLATSRKSVRFPEDDKGVEMFWSGGDLSAISTQTTLTGRACGRMVRLVRGRSIGVALGGGGALAFGHVGLLRTLEEAGLPMDYVAGVSFGALIGALYVGGGLDAVDELIRRHRRLMGFVAASVVSTRWLGNLVDEIAGMHSLGASEVPFYPVALNISTGREFVLDRGSLGLGVRSTFSLPGVFPALRVGTARLVDGGLVNNVPTSVLWEAGSDFIIGSHVLPGDPGQSRIPLVNTPVGRLIMGPLIRLDDTIRSLHLFKAQTSRDRSLLSDFGLDLSLAGYELYDFTKVVEIVDSGRRQAEAVLPAIQSAYEKNRSIRF